MANQGLLAARLIIGLVKNLFSKGFVWKLRAVIRLDNTVSLLVETFDCPLHPLQFPLQCGFLGSTPLSDKCFYLSSEPGRTRTCNPLIKRPSKGN
jgi:hypothetical protein